MHCDNRNESGFFENIRVRGALCVCGRACVRVRVRARVHSSHICSVVSNNSYLPFSVSFPVKFEHSVRHNSDAISTMQMNPARMRYEIVCPKTEIGWSNENTTNQTEQLGRIFGASDHWN